MGSIAAGTMSLDAYLTTPTDHRVEWVNGRTFAMAGGSPRHNAMAFELAAAIRPLLPAQCRGAGSDQRIHVVETGLFTYPDLVIACGTWAIGPGQALENPLVVVEVLSPSTEAYDRGAKFAHYRRIPSLREYVLISVEERRVEVFRRTDAGTWALDESIGAASVLQLASLTSTIRLGPLYDAIETLPA
jgi:Uma2 family endonuclease